MLKKILAIILCFSCIVGLLPDMSVPVQAKAEEAVYTVLQDGKTVEEIVLKTDEKQKLKVAGVSKGQKVQWQILADIQSENWIDIAGMNQNSMEVSYAMVKSLMDSSMSVYIRAKIGKNKSSSPVLISFQAPEQIQKHDVKIHAKKLKRNTKSEDRAGSEYVTIKINYLGEDNQELFSSYKGQLLKGTDYNTKVIMPTYLGFGAFKNPNNLSGTNPNEATVIVSDLDLNYTNLTKNVVINIYFKPIDVDYGARYFFQNINDDLYTEKADRYFKSKAKTGTIIEDQTLNDHAGDLTGFTALYHYPEAVAADGSTVFHVYYDRNYYLMNFDMDGGYGTEPFYARYETPFTVEKPKKSGYIFAGWDLLTKDSNGDGVYDQGDGAPDQVPSTIPAQNQRYRALWKKADASVTYMYWKENADDTGYSYWTSSSKSNMNSGDLVTFSDDIDTIANYPGKDERQYFVYNQTKTQQDNAGKVVNGDGSTIVNIYYSRKVYTLKFYYARHAQNWTGQWRYQVSTNTNGYTGNTSGNIGQALNSSYWEDVEKLPDVTIDGPLQKGSEKFNGDTYYYLTFTGKYGCDLSRIWPLRKIQSVNKKSLFGGVCNFAAWSPENSSYYNKHPGEFGNNITVKGVFLRLDKRILDNNNPNKTTMNFLGFWTGYWPEQKWIYHIHVQQPNGIDYKELSTFVTYDTNEAFKEQTPTSLEGFNYNTDKSYGQKAGDGWHAHFYYDRQSYTLNYYNYNETLQDKSQQVPFNQSLATYDFTPSYPKSLEKGAYEFAGWYTTPQCVEGTQYDFTTGKMPAKDMTLYAKWIPVKHTVRFFDSKEKMDQYEVNPKEELVIESKFVEHGKAAGSITDPVSPDTKYEFGGWFYIKNGNRVAYTPLDIPVTKDLNVFAEWKSKIAQPYKIEYVLKRDPSVHVADTTNGFAYQGTTRTFSAKSGDPFNQLKPEYNSGYFPTLASHSITMQYEENKTSPQKNVFTFEYVQAKHVAYTIRYLDAKTNEPLSEEITSYTDYGVVTERFKSIAGYVPDAFYKRLKIAVVKDADGSYVGSPENVITFYYTKSATNTFYAIHHMIQIPGTSGEQESHYKESDNLIEGVAAINSKVDITPIHFEGFKPDFNAKQVIQTKPSHITQNTSGNYVITIDKDGTDLYIYYRRQKYKYTVRYREYNVPDTNPDLHAEKIGPETEFNTQVTEEPIQISGYAPISKDSKTLKIKEKEEQNEIIFYYTQLQYMAEYKAAGKGGTLSQGMETVSGDIQFNGSKPIPDEGYEFKGWYLDPECKKPVTKKEAQIKQDNTLIPNKESMEPSPDKNVYYAAFKPITGDLTIQNMATAGQGNGDQVFVYRVIAQDGTYVEVSVKGNGSVTLHDLKIGNYTVKLMDEWSWRYAPAAQNVTVKKNVNTTVGMNPSVQKEYWLNGNSPIVINTRR